MAILSDSDVPVPVRRVSSRVPMKFYRGNHLEDLPLNSGDVISMLPFLPRRADSVQTSWQVDR